MIDNSNNLKYYLSLKDKISPDKSDDNDIEEIDEIEEIEQINDEINEDNNFSYSLDIYEEDNDVYESDSYSFSDDENSNDNSISIDTYEETIDVYDSDSYSISGDDIFNSEVVDNFNDYLVDTLKIEVANDDQEFTEEQGFIEDYLIYKENERSLRLDEEIIEAYNSVNLKIIESENNEKQIKQMWNNIKKEQSLLRVQSELLHQKINNPHVEGLIVLNTGKLSHYIENDDRFTIYNEGLLVVEAIKDDNRWSYDLLDDSTYYVPESDSSYDLESNNIFINNKFKVYNGSHSSITQYLSQNSLGINHQCKTNFDVNTQKSYFLLNVMLIMLI